MTATNQDLLIIFLELKVSEPLFLLVVFLGQLVDGLGIEERGSLIELLKIVHLFLNIIL